MAMQTRFARDMDLGFARDNLLIVRVPAGEDRRQLARSFATRSRAIRTCAASLFLLGAVRPLRGQSFGHRARGGAPGPARLPPVDARFFAQLPGGAARRAARPRPGARPARKRRRACSTGRRCAGLASPGPSDAIGQVLRGRAATLQYDRRRPRPPFPLAARDRCATSSTSSTRRRAARLDPLPLRRPARLPRRGRPDLGPSWRRTSRSCASSSMIDRRAL